MTSRKKTARPSLKGNALSAYQTSRRAQYTSNEAGRWADMASRNWSMISVSRLAEGLPADPMPMRSRPSAICAQARSIEEADPPVAVDDDHAVGRALEDHADPGCRFLGLLLGLGQFLLAVLQRIGHGVERVGDPADFGFIPDVARGANIRRAAIGLRRRPIGQADDG